MQRDAARRSCGKEIDSACFRKRLNESNKVHSLDKAAIALSGC